jgi:acetyl-CoA synthase
MGGGGSSPGFVGHSKFNITQGKFILGDGGLLRMVWMPKVVKDEIRDRLNARGAAMGVQNFADMIADETVGITEDEILPWLKEKGHPAISMPPIM